MLVFGQTAANLIVPSRFTIERVVDTGIDPWRLDLLDRDPAAVETAEGELLFRKLDNVSFAYVDPDDESRMFLCQMREGDCACVVGRWSKDLCGRIIHEPRETGESFAYHLTQYLRRVDSFEGSSQSPASARMPEAVCFEGSNLRFGGTAAYLSNQYICFTGTMVEEVFAETQLDERVNWVFEKLQRWNPKVIGPAVHQSMRGETPRLIQMYLDEGGINALWNSFQCYREMGGPLEFEREGTKYRVWDNSRWFDFHDYLLKQDEAYSADWLYAVGKNLVTGTRIALNDVGLGITRPLHFRCELDAKKRQIREGQGLKVVDFDTFHDVFRTTSHEDGWRKFRGASVMRAAA